MLFHRVLFVYQELILYRNQYRLSENYYYFIFIIKKRTVFTLTCSYNVVSVVLNRFKSALIKPKCGKSSSEIDCNKFIHDEGNDGT